MRFPVIYVQALVRARISPLADDHAANPESGENTHTHGCALGWHGRIQVLEAAIWHKGRAHPSLHLVIHRSRAHDAWPLQHRAEVGYHRRSSRGHTSPLAGCCMALNDRTATRPAPARPDSNRGHSGLVLGL